MTSLNCQKRLENVEVRFSQCNVQFLVSGEMRFTYNSGCSPRDLVAASAYKAFCLFSINQLDEVKHV